MRRSQKAGADHARGARAEKRRRRAMPEGFAPNAFTIVMAFAILLTGYLVAINLDRVLPSGKGTVTVHSSRTPLDESWMQNGAASVSLGVFPYDQQGGSPVTKLSDYPATLAAQLGVDRVMTLSQYITDQWLSGTMGNNAERVWSGQSLMGTDENLDGYLMLNDLQDKAGTTEGEAVDGAVAKEAVQPAAPSAPTLTDAQYIGQWNGTLPGLSEPDRWIVCRVPVAMLRQIDTDADNMTIYLADAVYHPSRGLTHLFLHEEGESFPSAFTRVDDEIALQFVQTLSSSFLSFLTDVSNGMITNNDQMDKKMGSGWSSGGILPMTGVEGVSSTVSDGCYLAGDVCAVSFPCGDGGSLLVYIDTTTMGLRGFSRLYAGQ